MIEDWIKTPLHNACEILDNLRKPINSSDRGKRIGGKNEKELFPYYGATGQVGLIDDYLTDGEFVLIGEDGAPFLDYSKNVAYKISGKSWVNNHAHILNSYFNNDFLLHFLNQVQYKDYVTGTTRLKLTQGALKRIPVLIAPLPIQRAIVAKIETLFSDLDNGIADLKKAQEQLKIYRQAVLKKAFEGDWETKALIQVCENIKVGIVIKPKKYYSKDNTGILAFRSANVREFRVEDSNWVYLTNEGNEQNSRTILKLGDVLIVRSGNPGTSCVVTDKYVSANAIDILIATPDLNIITSKYLCAFNNSPLAKGLFSEGARGVAQKHLNVGEYGKMHIPVPPIREQHKIVKQIESRLSVCDAVEESIIEALNKSKVLRQSILKKAFEGKLLSPAEIAKCKQEVDYEPASELLERIKQEQNND